MQPWPPRLPPIAPVGEPGRLRAIAFSILDSHAGSPHFLSGVPPPVVDPTASYYPRRRIVDRPARFTGNGESHSRTRSGNWLCPRPPISNPKPERRHEFPPNAAIEHIGARALRCGGCNR